MRKKNNIGLLPYTREDLYGLSVDSPQEYGWELKKFQIPSLWKKTKGEGVIVAVIDTGCDLTHKDLEPNLLKGKNFVDPNKDPVDAAGHGTHVSSTIAACDNGFGMVGISPETKIIPVKALGDNGSGSMNDIIDAIYWTADYTKANFITMSLGSPSSNNKLSEAVAYAHKKGKIIFCAAGNSGENTDVMFPAQYDDVISIGAIDEHLQRTNFTCSGESLDFLAPGHNILGCIPGNRYANMSGTSMSNPFSVGCASLLLSYNNKNHQYTLKTVDDYIEVFKKHCIDLSDPRYAGKKKYQGYGILNPVL
ncbi:MAG: S8 family peptidase [Flavobacterium sp.]